MSSQTDSSDDWIIKISKEASISTCAARQGVREFRDEPMRFAVGAESEEAAAQLREEIKKLRTSGELAQIILRMRLD